MERNESTIKCPRQLEEEGIIKDLVDCKILNHNPISRYNSRMNRRQKSEGNSESSSVSSSDSDATDDEEFDDYHVDGYHPAHVGELLDSKYVLLKKLGWGHFSCVWLAFKLGNKQLYALKI